MEYFLVVTAGVVIAGAVTLILGYVIEAVAGERGIAGVGTVVGMIAAVVIQLVEGDAAVTTTFLKNVGLAVAVATALMLILCGLMKWLDKMATRPRNPPNDPGHTET